MISRIRMMMKEKLMIITITSFILVVVFGIGAIAAVPRQIRVVKKFCKAIEAEDIEKMNILFYTESSSRLASWTYQPEEIFQYIDEKTQRVECLIGQPYHELDEGLRIIPIFLNEYVGTQLIHTQVWNIGIERVGSKDYISYIERRFRTEGGPEVVGGSPDRSRKADVNMQVLGKNRICVKYRIEYPQVWTEEEFWDKLEPYLERRNAIYGRTFTLDDIKNSAKVILTEENGVSCLYIEQKGTIEELQKSYGVLFGNNLGITYLHDGNFFALKNEVGIYQWIDFCSYALCLEMKGGVDYTIKLLPGTRILTEGESLCVSGRTLSIENGKSSQFFAISAQQWNLCAIGFWVMLLVTVISGGMCMYRYRWWMVLRQYIVAFVEKIDNF